MDLHEALTQIAEIRHQMARTEVFRGYRAFPVAVSGALALLAAVVQRTWIEVPAEAIGAYLTLWIGAAAVSAVASGVGIAARRRMDPSSWSREITRLALEQFAPCLMAGSLLTVVLARCRPESLSILPGLWQILFSLGVFASCRLLPRATWAVAAFYLASGLVCLALGEAALSPWAMGIPFAIGQTLAAAVLYWNLERGDVETE
ncbi:MAG: hypothetical protein JWN86_632 [Planctomycetota bacterium]|nr:hypothetical protein [Planctomycetota bacterium]